MPSRNSKNEDEGEEFLDIDEAPTEIDPYATLGIDKSATQAEITKAYRKAALKNHPDKVLESKKAAANTAFQNIAFAYAVLSDERRRRRYDITGRTEESLVGEDGEDDFDWLSFYRGQYKDIVTAQAIDAFSKEYRGSDEERDAILACYTKHKGSMNKLYNEIMLSDPAEDEDRFRAIIDEAIENGDVEPLKAYTEETEKSRNARVTLAKKRQNEEAKEAEEHATQLGIGANGNAGKHEGMGGLAALIQQRQKTRGGNFLADLEAKYAPKGKKGSKRAAKDDEPSEEAFAQTEARRTGKKGKKQ
ncbi:hypothetical protein B0A48_01679 [Cryoendolithus antarcticus]|uniref:J domain-containing protein n=1 Tax=Cryoendolithus antarcticus TaxID=1507870 RepID=A0A1V8TQD1_9PEZI|nr:hypothetical protein B0A48_01679 [Cryoendolithus antarcticus]